MSGGSFLVDRLPEHLAEDPFLVRFLGIFQAQADRLEEELVGIRHVADPTVAPPEIVRWLGTWLGVQAIDPATPVDRQRTLVRTAGRDLGRRGTAAGLQHLLEVVAATAVRITDTGSVRRAGGPPPGPKKVWVDIGAGSATTPEHLLDLVRRELPAGLELEVRLAGTVLWPVGATWTGPPEPPASPSDLPERQRRREPLRAERNGAGPVRRAAARPKGGVKR